MAVGGVGAWHLIKGRQWPEVRTMFSMAMWMAAIVAPVQIVLGDLHGLNTLEHEPAKVMAMEGHFQSHADGAPLALFGIPDQKRQRLDYPVEIPKLSSLILKHDLNAPLKGLDTVPRDRQPPVLIVFWSFRIMVGLGLLMVALGLASLWSRFRGTFYEARWLHRFALAMAPAGFLAVIAGWVTTEVGRQPYVIYGVLRTADAVSPVGTPAVSASLTAFVLVYFAVFGAGTWYLVRMMADPPSRREGELSGAPIRSAGITPSPAVEKN